MSKTAPRTRMIPLCVGIIYCLYSNTIALPIPLNDFTSKFILSTATAKVTTATSTTDETSMKINSPTPAAAASSISSIPDDEVSEMMVEDFDLGHRIPCGSHKCFVKSKTNKQEGYVIGENISEQLLEGYTYGQHLEDKYGISNLILSPPIDFESIPSLARKINSKAHTNGFSSSHKFCIYDDPKASAKLRGCTDIDKKPHKPMTIQKVKRIPNDEEKTTFFVKCSKDKHIPATRSNWDLFQQKLQQELSLSNTTTTTAIRDDEKKETGWLSLKRQSQQHNTTIKSKFLSQFESSIETLELIMSNEPIFLHDLQFLISFDGQIYHMDYDRVFLGKISFAKDPSSYLLKKKKVSSACIQLLHQMKNDAVNIIDYSKQN